MFRGRGSKAAERVHPQIQCFMQSRAKQTEAWLCAARTSPWIFFLFLKSIFCMFNEFLPPHYYIYFFPLESNKLATNRCKTPQQWATASPRGPKCGGVSRKGTDFTDQEKVGGLMASRGRLWCSSWINGRGPAGHTDKKNTCRDIIDFEDCHWYLCLHPDSGPIKLCQA